MSNFVSLIFNPVFFCIATVFFLSIMRLNVSVSLLIGSVLAGVLSKQGISSTLSQFSNGITAGAEVALNYAFLGVFAASLSKIGFTDYISSVTLKMFAKDGGSDSSKIRAKVVFLELFLLIFGIFSQNLIPIHIAFIPIFVPPLINIFNRACVDRRKIACILAFGLVTPYIFLPVGFGEIFLRNVVSKNMATNGISVNLSNLDLIKIMSLPALGMLVGLLFAVFISYRKERKYSNTVDITNDEKKETSRASLKSFVVGVMAIAVMFVLQVKYSSILLGACAGFLFLLFTGMIKWNSSDSIISEGFKMMAGIGIVMIVANGFSRVLISTNAIDPFVSTLLLITCNNKFATILVLLGFGWFLTTGIGSSFSTVPIISAIYVPICMQFGMSTSAIFALIATAGALGDAGSPVSDTALGPTIGLNIDGQHNHFKDTIIPTMLHFNIPLLIFGLIATFVL